MQFIKFTCLKSYRVVDDFRRSDEGQTMTEYAIILMLIALVIITALSSIAPPLEAVFNDVANLLGGS